MEFLVHQRGQPKSVGAEEIFVPSTIRDEFVFYPWSMGGFTIQMGHPVAEKFDRNDGIPNAEGRRLRLRNNSSRNLLSQGALGQEGT